METTVAELKVGQRVRLDDFSPFRELVSISSCQHSFSNRNRFLTLSLKGVEGLERCVGRTARVEVEDVT